MNTEKLLIWIVSTNPNGFIQNSMAGRFNEAGHRALSLEPKVNRINEYKEIPDAIIFCIDDELAAKTDALIYLRDRVVEEGIPVFTICDRGNEDMLSSFFDSTYIKGCFLRPVDVTEVIKSISEYIHDNGRQSKKKVLVVDDSGAMLRNVKAWLEGKYRVIPANSGAMAIKYMSRELPDLVLLDYEMPIVDGRQVLEMIRAEIDFQSVPVIFLTGKADKESVASVLALKPDGYLLKTMKPEEIVKAIDDFFERKKHI